MVQIPDKDSNTLRSEFKFSSSLISGLTGACSVISLITKLFHVGLTPLLGEFIEYYRQIAYYFIDALTFWWPFHLPGWYKDCVVIAFILSIPLVRALFYNSLEDIASVAAWKKYQKDLIFWLFIAVVSQVVLGFSLVGILSPGIVYFILGTDITDSGADVDVAVRYSLTLVTMIVASVVFFILNYQF